MVWVAVDKDGTECILHSNEYFIRNDDCWESSEIYESPVYHLPKGSIEKLIGKKLTWEDEPVELKEEEQC